MGSAPLEKGFKEKRDWGFQSRNYTSAQGYNIFSTFPNVPNNPLIWKRIWNLKNLPKIGMFI